MITWGFLRGFEVAETGSDAGAGCLWFLGCCKTGILWEILGFRAWVEIEGSCK